MPSERIPRRVAIARLGGLLTAAGLGAACAPIRFPSVATEPSRSDKGDALVFGQVQPMLTTNPNPIGGNMALRRNLFDPLVGLDAKRRPTPELAESWTVSDDHRTVTFKLREGVRFHSGRAFTAEDSRWNLEYAQDPRNKAPASDALGRAQFAARDGATLEVRLAEPTPHLFSVLAFTPMIDRQSDMDQNAGGTGPFKLEAFAPGDEARLVRNPAYWQSGLPHIERLSMKTYPDPSALLVALEAGSVRVAFPLPYNEIKRVQAGEQTTSMLLPQAGNTGYLLRVDDPPFTDKRVRQAMGLAMDRRRCVDSVLQGLGTATHSVWPPASPAWDASLDTGEFNLSKAAQLLAEAGYANGFETSITFSPSFSTSMNPFHQILQADLAKIGVKAKIISVEDPQRVQLIADSRFDGLMHYGYGQADLDPAYLPTFNTFRPDKNASHFESADYTRLVEMGRLELDEGKRTGIYHQITRLLKDEAFFLPVVNPQLAYGLRRDVQGFAGGIGAPAQAVFANVSLAH